MMSLLPTGHAASDEQSQATTRTGHYIPTPSDVHTLRTLLSLPSHTCLPALPVELVDIIIDLAQYWPRVRARADYRMVAQADANVCYLTTPPFAAAWRAQSDSHSSDSDSEEEVGPPPKIQRIVFELESHDQGWGGAPGDKGTCYVAIILPQSLHFPVCRL